MMNRFGSILVVTLVFSWAAGLTFWARYDGIELTLFTLPFLLALGWALPWLFTAGAAVEGIALEAYWALGFGLIGYALAVAVRLKTKRGIKSTLVAVLIGFLSVEIAIFAQSKALARTMLVRAERLDPDCVEITSLRSFLRDSVPFDGGRLSGEYHGVARAGGVWFIWSYTRNGWVEVDPKTARVPLSCAAK